MGEKTYKFKNQHKLISFEVKSGGTHETKFFNVYLAFSS